MFDDSGKPIPNAQKGSWNYERAVTTIFHFYLDSTSLVDARKEVWKECDLLIGEVNSLLEQMTKSISITPEAGCEWKLKEENMKLIKERIKEKKRELIKRASPQTAFSATACACLLSRGYEWSQNIAKKARAKTVN